MLKDIHSGDDLRALGKGELTALAGEIRQTIIRTVLSNGGHLSSNLGSVELTLALHRVLDLPRDKLVFDVGHQSYTHKLLTGRLEKFGTLRQKGGLGGFMRPDESPYDVCMTGHASSSISTALGLARARDIMGGSHRVVAVIGDGALTGGLSYEALNDAGHSGTRLIVVLNDNAMSISRNVGAMSAYLTNLRQSTPYRSIKRGIRSGLSRIPLAGRGILRALEKVRNALRTLFLEDRFFEALGFEYQGPIDGHNIRQMEKVLRRAADCPHPVLIHVVTKKGNGYAPAEEHPDRFHGVAPFFVGTGAGQGEQAVENGRIMAAELIDMALRDLRVCAVTAAMPAGTGLSAFAKACPDRFYDVGIAEEHAVSMAAGLALAGMRPYVAVYSTFLQRAFDQILTEVCLQNLPVTLLVDRAGLVGSDGATHQGAFDLMYLGNLPGMTLAAPRDQRDLRRLLQLSLSMEGPMAIRYPKDAFDMGPGMQEGGELKPGEWELLMDGHDVMILAVGRMVELALAVSIELNGKQLSCGVMDARFIKPMDEEKLFQVANRVALVVTLEEGSVLGGFGCAVMEKLAKAGVQVPLLPLGIPDCVIEQGSIDQQMEDAGLTCRQVSERIRERMLELFHGDQQD